MTFTASHLIPHKRVPTILTLAATLGFGLLSCSDDVERNYNTPTSLCGVSISAASLAPVLPAGDKVTQKSVSPADGVKRCQVSVDGKIALVAGQEWWNDKPNLTRIAEGQAHVELDYFSADGTYIYSERGAVGKVKCAKPIRPENELFTVLQVPEPGKADATAIKKIITAFTTALSSSDQCTRDN